ncbi:MAG: hypothetical protein HY694_00915 [Deltaproteobacteria bacterium]|nr:hypothetical protein [Deltaproteobacteria bacterium]
MSLFESIPAFFSTAVEGLGSAAGTGYAALGSLLGTTGDYASAIPALLMGRQASGSMVPATPSVSATPQSRYTPPSYLTSPIREENIGLYGSSLATPSIPPEYVQGLQTAYGPLGAAATPPSTPPTPKPEKDIIEETKKDIGNVARGLLWAREIGAQERAALMRGAQGPTIRPGPVVPVKVGMPLASGSPIDRYLNLIRGLR